MAQQGIKEKLKARKEAISRAQTASKPRAAGPAKVPAQSATAEQVARMVKPRSQVIREGIAAREAKGGGRQTALRRELLIENTRERMKKSRSTGRGAGRR